MVLLVLQFLTPMLFYLPKSTLAAIVTMAVTSLFEFNVIKTTWKVSKAEALVSITTIFTTFAFNSQIGICCGVLASLLHLIYSIARPRCRILGQIEFSSRKHRDCNVFRDIHEYSTAKQIDSILILSFGGSLYFFNIPVVYFEKAIMAGLSFTENATQKSTGLLSTFWKPFDSYQILGDAENQTAMASSPISTRILILDFSQISSIDTIACSSLIRLIEKIETNLTIKVLFANVSSNTLDVIYRVQDGFPEENIASPGDAGFKIKASRIFLTIDFALEYARRLVSN
jgi:MFS superfamily sulfate permease-like transporter